MKKLLSLNLIEADVDSRVEENRLSSIAQNGKSLRGSAVIDQVNRPIHYLGSKLRLLDAISETIDRVDPAGGTVCDLFSGSGTVSGALASSRDVIAVDIQEYSRVLSSALLNNSNIDDFSIDGYLEKILNSQHFKELSWAVEPLISYEEHCLEMAGSNNSEPLCDLLEHGSIVAFEKGLRLAKEAPLRSAIAEVVKRLASADLIKGPKALATRYYGGSYFSYSQTVYLDILLEGASVFADNKRDLFLAAVLSTASDVVNTVGKQFAQPIRPRTADGKPKRNLSQQVWRDRSLDVVQVYRAWIDRYINTPRGEGIHKTVCSDYAEFLKNYEGNINVVYADPPYTRDHYSRFYHVLETFCLRDNPDISTVRINGEDQISRGLYRQERHQSPFCIKTQAPRAFSTLFTEVGRLGVPLVLSYSPFEKDSGARPRLMAIKDIVSLAEKTFRKVEVVSAGKISHNKLNNSEKNKGISYDAEVLIVCEP